jgi:hypothetical protein
MTVASRDPSLLGEYRPHGDADGIVTNRYGFRDVDYPTPRKPPGIDLWHLAVEGHRVVAEALFTEPFPG